MIPRRSSFRVTKNNLAVNPFTSVHYSTNGKFVGKPTSTIPVVEIPKTIEDLKSKTFDEIKELFAKTRVLDEDDLKEICLKGSNLYTSCIIYQTNLASNGTKQTAREAVIKELMLNQKVKREEVANLITDWLINFIYTDINVIRSLYKQLASDSRKVYAEVREKLQKAGSQFEVDSVMGDGKNSISILRNSFFNTWDKTFNSSALPLLDASILEDIAVENLITISSIRNDSAAKMLYQHFHKEPTDTTQHIPLPIVNNSIKIQYLGLLDNTSNEVYFNYSKKSFSIAIAPSGSGKTHEILKYGHSKNCLFFNGSLPIDSDLLQLKTSEIGFKDESVAYLESICTLHCQEIEADHFVNNFVVEYFTSVLILSRLLYLDFLKTTFQSKLTPANFLLSQLNGNSIAAARVFENLLNAKLKHKFVIEMIRHLQAKYNVFAVLDEANVFTTKAITTRIVSYNFSDEQRPILASVAKTLVDNIDYVIFAGTTLEVTTAVKVISAIGKELEHPLHFPAKFKRSKEEITEVFNQVINIDGCEGVIEKHSSYLYGSRVRLFMKIIALLPQYLKDGLSKSSQFETATIDAILIIRNDIKAAIQSKYNDSNPLERSVIINTLVEYFVQFTTIGYYEKSSQNIEIDLVNLAICELVSKSTLSCNQPLKYFYSTDRVCLEAVALFLIEQKRTSDVVLKFSSMLKSFDNNQSLKGYTIEMFFACMLCLRYFAGRSVSNTAFHIGDIQPAALINWIPSTLHSQLRRGARKWLKTTKCEAFIVKQFQNAKDFVDNMQPNIIHVVNNASMPDIFLYNDEFILAFAFKSAKDTVNTSNANATVDTLNISKIIASKSTRVDHLDELNRQAMKKIGDLQLRKYQLKISVFLENSQAKFQNSVKCTNNEIFVKISSSDITSLFPESLRHSIAYLLKVAVNN